MPAVERLAPLRLVEGFEDVQISFRKQVFGVAAKPVTQYTPRDTYEFWTTPEVKQLKALMEGGFSYSEIAREMGRPRNAISGKIRRLRQQRRL